MSEQESKPSELCSDEGLTLETSAPRNSLRRLIYLYQLRVDNQHSVSLARRRSITVSLETIITLNFKYIRLFLVFIDKTTVQKLFDVRKLITLHIVKLLYFFSCNCMPLEKNAFPCQMRNIIQKCFCLFAI